MKTIPFLRCRAMPVPVPVQISLLIAFLVSVDQRDVRREVLPSPVSAVRVLHQLEAITVGVALHRLTLLLPRMIVRVAPVAVLAVP